MVTLNDALMLLHAKLVFTNKDRIDWATVIRNNEGRLMMDVVGHLTRKK